MPGNPTYPGVYIDEIPSGVRTINGVATSIAAFVGDFNRGPINRAVSVLSFGDVEREFGGLRADSEASYGLRQFYLNGGAKAWVVRAASGGFATATITLRDDLAADSILLVRAGRQMGGVAVEDPGAWGNNLRIEVDYNTYDPTDLTLFNLSVSETTTQNGQQVAIRTESYRNISMDPTAGNYAVNTINEDSKLIQLTRLSGTSSLTRPAASGLQGGDASGAQLDPGDTFNVAIVGENTHLAAVSNTTPITGLADIGRHLQAAIRAIDPANPLLSGASVQLVGTQFRVLTDRGGAQFDGETIIELNDVTGDAIASSALETGVAAANTQQYVMGSSTSAGSQLAGVAGADGDPLSAADLEGSELEKTGLYALEDVDLFNILCIPRSAQLYENNPIEMSTVVAAAEAYCLKRRAFFIVDVPPSVNSLSEATDWLEEMASLRHQNAAAYFPRLKIPDPLNALQLRSMGASGTIAGLYARTDASRGVWKAPAGIEVTTRNVSDLDHELTDAENDVINALGLNALRDFNVHGTVVWGARTLVGADQMASDFKYIPVRRTTLFIEETLSRNTQWAVFEPNDEPLWAQLRLNISAFMHDLFRQGAFQGTRPSDAYLVKVDSGTTTRTDIDRGVVNILIGFAAIKPAEFIIVKIQQRAGQIN